VQTLADPTGRQPAVAHTVAVISSDELVVRRISACLSTQSIAIVDRAADVIGLSEHTSEASAIVIAPRSAANNERRTLIRGADERFPNVPIVVVASLSMNGVHKAIEAGASGLVLEAEVESALPATIRAVQAGQVVVPHRFRHHAARPALSHREKQTLALAAAGMTNRQIAAQLFLAESTVKTHLTSVFAKLGVGSRSEAAALVHDPEEKLGLSMLGIAPAGSVANGQALS
jgi:DNA-binding NarL/FixJ family response regulator